MAQGNLGVYGLRWVDSTTAQFHDAKKDMPTAHAS